MGGRIVAPNLKASWNIGPTPQMLVSILDPVTRKRAGKDAQA
jgi:hypothetical protein